EDHAKEKGHEDHDACCEDHAKEEGHEHHHHHGGLDPHIWTSPSLAKREMENIMKGLCEKDPENADYYKSNYKKYSEEFDKLDKEFKTEIEKLPNRDIVVSHEAFGYLAKDYGLNQIGIEGLIPESEPTPQKMAEIIDFVKDNNVKVIFFETTSGSKVADSIGKATGAKPMVLNTLESLTKEEVESGDDYFSVMRKNLEAIKEALK
ncbi:MAG: zinc ABC transporter substrate-binding protein, partial [Tissierellia bacterium]|nr:zinc ABC transporter substrate-binding protein [Tissierellia bacterium]